MFPDKAWSRSPRPLPLWVLLAGWRRPATGLPPLFVPGVRIEVAELGRVNASTRQTDIQHVNEEKCVSYDENESGNHLPALKDARFLPSTAKPLIMSMNDKPGTRIEIAKNKDRFRICMDYTLNNTSGTWNSFLRAAISVERVVRDNPLPIATALSPIKLIKVDM